MRETLKLSSDWVDTRYPYKETLAYLSVDKIGLICPKDDLIMEAVNSHKKSKVLNFMVHGDTVTLMIHHEFRPDIVKISVKCLMAIIVLCDEGIFTPEFYHRLKKILQRYADDFTYSGPSCENVVLPVTFFRKLGFTLTEWETAMDFYKETPVVYAHPSKFHVLKGTKTIYSNDNEKFWKIDKNGNQYSDGVQDSFFCLYERHLVTGESRPCYRLEFRHEGKYQNHLSWKLLADDSLFAFYVLLPSLVHIMQILVERSEYIKFSEGWCQYGPKWFKDFIEASELTEPGRVFPIDQRLGRIKIAKMHKKYHP